MKTYVPNIENILCFCIEVETSAEYCCKSVEEHEAIGNAITASAGNPVKEGDIKVVRRILPPDFPFDFDSVHHLPLNPLIESTPIVVEMVYKEKNGRCFVRVKNDLMHYDGVTAAHMGLGVLEILEQGNKGLSDFPFTTTNGPIPGSNWMNFLGQLALLLWLAIRTLFSSSYWTGKFVRGPFQASHEEKLRMRPGFRFSDLPPTFTFRDFLDKMDLIRRDLNLDRFAITINYSPKVALSLVPNLEALTSRDGRLAHITLPPVGVDGPAPMNKAHVIMLSNSVFFNNYGRHSPKITGKVVDFLWDWTGTLKSFPVFFFAIQIQGKLFLRVCGPSPDMAIIADRLDGMGPAKSFTGRPMHVIGKGADHDAMKKN